MNVEKTHLVHDSAIQRLQVICWLRIAQPANGKFFNRFITFVESPTNSEFILNSHRSEIVR